MLRTLVVLSLSLLLGSCTGVPEGIRPVQDFELARYLGRWYEIARLDHPFERGLSHVTAEYSLRDDGSVRVLNRGYAAEQREWKQAEGTARFAGAPQVGHLLVSFFGPLRASYVVFELDREDYGYALVSGPDRSALWLLARSPRIEPSLRDALLAKAATLGFDTGALIFVDHAEPQPR